MKLFDNFKRFTNPTGHKISRYDYVNQSNSKECGEIRNILENWFKKYPEKHKKEFLSRFQTKNDKFFLSAFFELYLHQLFICFDYEVEIHPKMENGKNIDFLIKKNKEEVYIEATVSTGETEIKKPRLIQILINKK